MKATSTDGSIVNLGINGITAQSVSSAVISNDQSSTKTTISLTVIGQIEINNPDTITVPKTIVPCFSTPTIYVNNQVALDQGFRQDSNNYYFWYKTISSNYELSIELPTNPTNQFPISVILVVAIIGSLSLVMVAFKKIKQTSQKDSIEDEY